MSIYFLLTTTLEAQHTSRALIDEPMELSWRYLPEKHFIPNLGSATFVYNLLLV